jgi:hypothetical protein
MPDLSPAAQAVLDATGTTGTPLELAARGIAAAALRAAADQVAFALLNPHPGSAATNLAARPLLEKVARMADCIDQRTVSEIIAISNQAEAWLNGNPPGQPVAIEPRGCPTPGACSCVEPAAQPEPAPTDEELYELWNSEGIEADFQDCRRFARAYAARWGTPANNTREENFNA